MPKMREALLQIQMKQWRKAYGILLGLQLFAYGKDDWIRDQRLRSLVAGSLTTAQPGLPNLCLLPPASGWPGPPPLGHLQGFLWFLIKTYLTIVIFFCLN